MNFNNLQTNIENENYNKNYWNEFYKQYFTYEESSFCRYVKSKIDQDTFVIDLGCGIGQDTWSFYKDGYSVLGVDRSSIAIEQNIKLKNELDLQDSKINFKNIDINSQDEFASLLYKSINEAHLINKKVLIYARFLLHSIGKDVEKVLLENVSEYLTTNDLFAVEFRTQEDKNLSKVYKNHFRRYINDNKLVESLEYDYKFKIVEHYRGTGMSVYKNENPFLARILAEKLN